MCRCNSNYQAALGTIFLLIGFTELFRWQLLDFAVWFFIAAAMLLNMPKLKSTKLFAVGSLITALILLAIRLTIDFIS